MLFWGLVGLLGLFLMGSILIKPFKFLLRMVFYITVGGVLLVVVNLLLGHLGLRVAVNPVTLLTAEVLQVPGVILLAVLDYLFT